LVVNIGVVVAAVVVVVTKVGTITVGCSGLKLKRDGGKREKAI
jgi:hypothetical protein